ncbi:MAG: septum formation initiator family protein [Lentisphaeria bacterium]|nr:septum formation initiator family protein [Lentisphaeria bacterium]
MADPRRKKNGSPSNYLLYLLIALALAAAAVLLWPVYLEQQKKVNELSGLQEELNSKRAVSAELSKEVNALQQSPDAVEKVAREKFKLCREGETVLEYNDPAKSASGR